MTNERAVELLTEELAEYEYCEACISASDDWDENKQADLRAHAEMIEALSMAIEALGDGRGT